jgi:hypothetical protein
MRHSLVDVEAAEREFMLLSPNHQTLSAFFLALSLEEEKEARKRFVTVVFDGITIKRNEFFLIAFYEVEGV